MLVDQVLAHLALSRGVKCAFANQTGVLAIQAQEPVRRHVVLGKIVVCLVVPHVFARVIDLVVGLHILLEQRNKALRAPLLRLREKQIESRGDRDLTGLRFAVFAQGVKESVLGSDELREIDRVSRQTARWGRFPDLTFPWRLLLG